MRQKSETAFTEGKMHLTGGAKFLHWRGNGRGLVGISSLFRILQNTVLPADGVDNFHNCWAYPQRLMIPPGPMLN